MISKYLDLGLRWLKLSMSREATHKLNFICNFIGWLTYGFIMPILMYFVYRLSPGIPGWSFWEIMLFTGTAHLVWGICSLIFIDLGQHCIAYVKDGKFDTVLIRPAKPLLLLTAMSVSINNINSLTIGLLLTPIAIVKLGLHLTMLGVLSYLTYIAIAIFFMYGLFIIIASLTFLVTKANSVYAIMDILNSYSDYPINIYGPVLQFVFTFVIPIGAMAFYPASALLGRISFDIIWKLAISVSAFFAASLLIWAAAMKKYTSAGG